MHNPIFRKKNYTCADPHMYMEEINCIHWSIETPSCKKTCAIGKVTSPDVLDCMKCQVRQGYPEKVLQDDLKTHKFTQLTVSKTPKTFTEKAANYVKAESSQFFQGTVDDEIYNERKAQCMECPFRVNNIKDNQDEIGWCNTCGCGIGTDRAKLSTKLRMPSLICPKHKFGPAVGKGFNIIDAVDSVKGAIKVIKKAIG
jgi:hypothetical protein